MILDKWSELRTVLYVAKHGTVSAAAAALGYHRATINRHIDALETEIGARIFLRHAQGYSLTEVGEEVVKVAQATQNLTGGLYRRVHEQPAQIDGEVRITLLAPFAELLMDALNAFTTIHQNCRIFIDTNEKPLRLEYGEVHIAIRAGGRPEHPDYVVQSLGNPMLSLYGHRNYFKNFGIPKSSDDMANHRFVVPRDNGRNLPFWPWIEANVDPNNIVLSTDDIWVSVNAISRGIGLGFLGDFKAQAHPNLQPVLPADQNWTVQLWLVTHVDVHRTAKVQAISKCIKDAF